MNNKERLIAIKTLRKQLFFLNNKEIDHLVGLTLVRKKSRAVQKKLLAIATYKGGDINVKTKND